MSPEPHQPGLRDPGSRTGAAPARGASEFKERRAVRPGPRTHLSWAPWRGRRHRTLGTGRERRGHRTPRSVSSWAPGRRRRVSDPRLCGGVHDFFAPSQPRHLDPEPTLGSQERFKPAKTAAMRAQEVPPLRDEHDGNPPSAPSLAAHHASLRKIFRVM